MAATVSAMDMVAATRQRTLSQPEPVDEAAVAQFLAGAEGQPREAIIAVIQRGHSMIQRGERSRGVSLETMATVCDRMTAMLAQQ